MELQSDISNDGFDEVILDADNEDDDEHSSSDVEQKEPSHLTRIAGWVNEHVIGSVGSQVPIDLDGDASRELATGRHPRQWTLTRTIRTGFTDIPTSGTHPTDKAKSIIPFGQIWRHPSPSI